MSSNIADLAIQDLTRKEFKDLLGTEYEYDTEEFWQDDSDAVFYMDGDLNTILNAISDAGLDYQYFSFYHVNDDQYFAM